MDPIEAAIAAIELREPGKPFSYRKIAKEFGVVVSTLTRRHQRVTQSRADGNANQRNLSQQQEAELLRYITRLTERGLPPTRQMIQSFASCIAKKEVSISWVDRFIKRNSESLLPRWTLGIDSNRHNADSGEKYKAYFNLLHSKITKYGVEPQHTYNMDEKGFLLGITGRSKRIFNRALYESRQVRQSIQDGSREWISLMACICADGSTVDPALIYRSTAETLQSSWVEEIDVNSHRVFITSSTSGWSNNEIGLQWLIQVFDRCTKQKARRQWRLLILDGHGSHVTMDFINYCDQNKILLAIFPPHATHTLQPLDVCVFKSLSAAYSHQLTTYLYRSQGLVTVAKKDFFTLLWSAWTTSVTPQLIMRAFKCTGISPPDPTPILSRFNPAPPPEQDSRERSTSVLSASDWRKIDRLLKVVADTGDSKEARKLSRTIHSISTQKQLQDVEIQGLQEALKTKKRRKIKGKTLPLGQPDEWQGGAVFWSPARVQRARDSLSQQETQALELQHQKAREKEIKASNKQLKARLLQEKRVARAAAREARTRERADAADKRRLRAQARKAQQQHQRRLKIAKNGSQKGFKATPKVTKRQRLTLAPGRVNREASATPAPATPSSRSGRAIKTPSRYL
jgi:hypothetical protein